MSPALRSLAVALLLPLAAAGQARPALDPRIPPVDRARHESGWAKAWPNPRVVVDLEAVFVLRGREALGEATRPVADVAAALAALPRRAWPHGRVVALSVTPRLAKAGDDPPARARLDRVREALRALGLEIVETPVGCDCPGGG